jgi:rRNA maturation protein Nop10
MKLRKCLAHEQLIYTLKLKCPKCNQLTKDAHYKFIKLKNVTENSDD